MCPHELANGKEPSPAVVAVRGIRTTVISINNGPPHPGRLLCFDDTDSFQPAESGLSNVARHYSNQSKDETPLRAKAGCAT